MRMEETKYTAPWIHACLIDLEHKRLERWTFSSGKYTTFTEAK